MSRLRRFLGIFSISVLCFGQVPVCEANPYVRSYTSYLTSARDALHDGDYKKAIFYLEVAAAIDPSRDEPRKFINYIRRLKEGQVVSIISETAAEPELTPAVSASPTQEAEILLSTPARQSSDVLPKVIPRTRPTPAPLPADNNISILALKVRPAEPGTAEEPITRIQPALISSSTENISNKVPDEIRAPLSSTGAAEFAQQVKADKLEKKSTGAAEVRSTHPAEIVSTASANPAKKQTVGPITISAKISQPAAVAPINANITPSASSYSEQAPASAPPPLMTTSSIPFGTGTPASLSAEAKMIRLEGVLKLDDNFWQKQPNTSLVLEMGKSLVLTGKDIRQFLVITPEILKVERINANSIRITAIKYGFTYLHLWDSHGRWTFNVRSILPQSKKHREKGNEWGTIGEEWANPFRFKYTTAWSSYYMGDTLPHLHRQNLSFEQWAGMYGETPYGDFDASLRWYKFQKSTELVGKVIGLKHGNLGPFEDFTIRGYDTWEKFSDLTLPGRDIRGFVFKSYAFDRNLHYTYLQGSDRANFFYFGPGIFQIKKSYVDGGRVVLFPDGERQLALNYVRGSGIQRANYLPEVVYSVEATQKSKDFESSYEYARDDSQYGQMGYMRWMSPGKKFTVAGRDLPKNFYTITDQPINQGEAGGNLIFDWNPGNSFHFNTDLDLYRDRKLGDPNDWMNINVEWGTNLSVPLDENSTWDSSAYFDDTPQLIDPRRNLRFDNTYTRNFNVWGDRQLSLFGGNTSQWSRFPDSSTSDYDRYSLLAGFRVPIWKRLSYYAQYEYAWAKDIDNHQLSHPTVFTTGLGYSRQLVEHLSLNTTLTYRDEENTTGKFSFLSGEDSLRGTWGLSYNPSQNLQIYLDGELSNIWAQTNQQASYNEASVRLGVQTGWDTPFRWNPTGTVKGIVFKDTNGNAVQEINEPGIPGVIVRIGRHETITGPDGRYHLKVSAKKVRVTPDVDSIPRGFVFSTPVGCDASITQGKTATVNFGLTTRSSIYGVVYNDKNRNGQVDRGEKGLVGVKITLDDEKTVVTDFEGVYTFDGLAAGKHLIKIDLNSLPKDYLPLIKIENEVDVAEGTTYVFQIPLRKMTD